MPLTARSVGGRLIVCRAFGTGPVAALIEKVVRSTGYADWLKARYPDNHEDRWENVAQLVSSAAEFEAKGGGRGLPEYLEGFRHTIAYEQARDVVSFAHAVPQQATSHVLWPCPGLGVLRNVESAGDGQQKENSYA